MLPGVDASKVTVTGAGVQGTGVGASLPVSFNVDPTKAGIADLAVIIQVCDWRHSDYTIIILW